MNRTKLLQFHNDLKAALLVNAPLAGCKGKRLTASRLDQLQRQLGPVGSRIDEDSESSDAIFEDQNLPEWYRAALKVFARTGSMLPVLEGLSARTLAIRDVHRALRWTVAYVLIVALTALLGLVLFQVMIVPELKNLRADLVLPAAIEIADRFDVLPWVPALMAVMLIVVIMGLPRLVAGDFNRTTFLPGCRRYVRSTVSTTVLRVTQTLVQSDTDVDTALALGFDLTGAEAGVRSEVQSLIPGTDNASAIGRMADYMRLLATRHLAYIQNVLPVALTVVVGGAVALIFCVVVFWPIISLLQDLLTARA